MRQPLLSWPSKKPDEGVEREEDKEMSDKRQAYQSNWVKGCGEEDNERYRTFLKYCEDRRQESKLQQEMDEERKKKAERRERQWDLIRLSTEYLKQNEPKWRTRKIEECERIKEEEKKDRLAIASQKKKRYGLKRLNKEENSRLKKRTEERLELSQAKANYWKWHRGEGRAESREQRRWSRRKERSLEQTER